ncbi:MAG: hypothetical protein V4692_03350, partial [Bdellovibrionota bacterium]
MRIITLRFLSAFTTLLILFIHDSRQQALGDTYARFSEEAFAAVAPVFGVWPDKTVVIVDDSTDSANGWATPFPYPTISAFPVLPTATDSIGDFGDWGLELMTHEYTHVLNFEPANGFFKPVRWIFGSIVRPNVLIPRWYSEGLATAMETRFSNHGRLRSNNYLAIIRSMVKDSTLRTENIGRIGEGIPDWPGGMRPYLMGALLWDDMIRRGGIEIVGKLNYDYSRRFPFFINGPVKSYLGLDYKNLLNKLYDRLETASAQQMIKIKAAGGATENLYLREGNWVHSPAFSPDGKWLAAVAHAHNRNSYVVLSSVENGNLKEVDRKKPGGDSIHRIAWFPDSRNFVYDALFTFDRYYEYSDLWRYDIVTKKRERLTKGARAREPMVSRDGKSLIFVQSTPGSTQLSTSNADGTGIRVLYIP